MRILFVGNSHTYANGLAYQVREMINAPGGPGGCESWMVTTGGRNLAWHADETGTQLSIACNRWDYVVLQQQTHPFDGYAQLAADCDRLLPHIAKAGAQALLYITWKKKDAPETDQDELDAAFARAAGERSLRLVPVGPAWRRARAEHPAIELYAPDGSHASPAGTYLAACIFYRVLTGRSPVGRPARIAVGETVLADLSPEDAAALQRVAAQDQKRSEEP
jgi:hypothetical protein